LIDLIIGYGSMCHPWSIHICWPIWPMNHWPTVSSAPHFHALGEAAP